jgi:predicted RNA-binding Zn ribbon-like protein
MLEGGPVTRQPVTVVGVPASPDLRLDAGATWLDLLASVGNAYGTDPVERLTGPPVMQRWLDHHGLTAEVAPTEADVADARALRETLRPLVLAVLEGTPVPTARLDDLQRWLDADVPVRAVVRAGRPAPARPPTPAVALARVARQALEQLGGPQAEHLHACADDDCRMAFLDPGGRRRWCAPERCGVRARVRAHRARARSASG